MQHKIPIVTFLAVIILQVAALAQSPYTVERHSDRNGNSYTSVTGDPAGVRIYTLRNGLTVYLAKNLDEPRVRSMVAVRAGSAFDPPDNTGLAHYLEHLLFNGTDSIGALNWRDEGALLDEIVTLFEEHKTETSQANREAIYSRIDSLSVEASKFAVAGEYRKLASLTGGVAINGYTNYDISAFWSLVSSSSLDAHLRLEAERFRNPVFRAFHTELEIVYEEFVKQQSNDLVRKRDALGRLLYSKHPYGQQTPIGTADHLRNPSPRSVISYYRRYYVPGNMAVVLVGDLDFDETIRLVDRYFGSLPEREVSRPALPAEPPLAGPVEGEIRGSGDESVYMGFRLGGANSRDEKLAILTDMILNNGFAGLFDIELNTKQKVKQAGSTVWVQNDYSVHYFDGYPREGQSLEEVRDLMLQQIDRIKKGDFDDWLLRGAVNDLKKQQSVNFSTSVNLSAACMHSFIRGESWRDRLSFNDDLSKITKNDLMDFVTRNYNNYALVFKRTGPSPGVEKIEQPALSPINLNAAQESQFARNFIVNGAPEGVPKFVNYDEEIVSAHTASGVEVSFVENNSTDLFELNVIVDMGNDHSKKLNLAAQFCNLLGTTTYSVEELKKQYYEMGLTFNASSNSYLTTFQIEGLQENLDVGIKLLDHFLSNLVPDSAAYAGFVDQIIKDRSMKQGRMSSVLREGMLSYALYGDNSPLRNIYSESELRAIRPDELTDIIKDIRTYKHRIFYYGKDLNHTMALLDTHYRARPVKDPLPKQVFLKNPAERTLYFVDWDNTQTGVMVVSRGNIMDAASSGYSNFFSPYIDYYLYKEIRESRALAYSTAGAHLQARDTGRYDYTYLYAGTQAEKVAQTVERLLAYMHELPGSESDVQYVSADQLKRYRDERITGTNVFWTYENLKRRGINYDIRADMYADVEKMTFDKLRTWFDKNIGGRGVSILVLGKRSEIDFDALAGFGEVREMDVKYLFNH